MTKEPIMIDDVDVSGCEFYCYSGNHGELTHYCAYQKDEDGLDTLCNADFNKNCFYKEILRMLKRKEEEYDQLKAENDDLKKTILQECPNCGEEYLNYKGVELYDENNQLKAENKKLKELLNTRIEDLCDSCGASSMMPMPCKVYEQALQEIQEIAYELTSEEYTDFIEHKQKQILQKCEDVL